MGLANFLPPVSERGALRVDGGYRATRPIDAAAAAARAGVGGGGARRGRVVTPMRSRAARVVVIAVDVAAESAPPPSWEWGAELSGWQILLHRLNPFSRGGAGGAVPTVAEINSLLVWCASEGQLRRARQRARAHGDSLLLLSPPVAHFSTIGGFAHADEIVAIGYAHAKAQLARWAADGRLPVAEPDESGHAAGGEPASSSPPSDAAAPRRPRRAAAAPPPRAVAGARPPAARARTPRRRRRRP